MHSFRRFRKTAAFIALFAMLFMQLALASYVCPDEPLGTETAAVPAHVVAEYEAMPGCVEVDMEQPGLCHAHAQVGNQSMDKPDVPQIQPFVAHGFTQKLLTVDVFRSTTNPGFPASLIARATAPPLSIRNCCFRI